MRQNEIDTARGPMERNEDPRRDRADARDVAEVDDGRQERRIAGPGSWAEIKSRFVDDPAGAIAAADELVRACVEDKLRRLQESYEALRMQRQGEDASNTESLRNRLLRYQAYFESLQNPTAH